MGVPLTTLMFIGLDPVLQSQLQIPMVVYQGLQILGGSLLTTPFRKWVDMKERFSGSEPV